MRGALLTTIVALAATPAVAAAAPGPDPYPSQDTPAPTPAGKPSAPAPDPAPSASKRSSPTTRSLSPDAVSQPSTTQIVQTPKTVQTPTPRTTRPSVPPARSSPAGARVRWGSPVTSLGKGLTLAVAPATLSDTASTSGGPLLLGALALLALVLASGSLLHLLTRADLRWRKA